MDATGELLQIWAGSQAPEPSFDTAPLGEDLSWIPQGMPSDAGFEDKGYVVYLGHASDKPMLMWADERAVRNPWDYVYQWFMGHSGRDQLTATFDCCYYSVSEGDGATTIDPQVGSAYPPDGTFTLQWLEVPSNTSILAFRIDGEPWAFQRPVGRVSSVVLRNHEWPFDVTFEAYGVDGSVLDSITFTYKIDYPPALPPDTSIDG